MHRPPPVELDRRHLLRLVLLGGAAAVSGPTMAGCAGSPTTPTPTPTTGSANSPSTISGGDVPTTDPTATRTLLVYFSRAGENYYYGGRRTLEVGNTQVLAEMISRLIPCDVYRIEAADPYSDAYDDTVARNVEEQDSDARPGIAQPLPSIEQYDTVLLGSPVWNVRAPMIMSTFVEGVDLTGKTVLPFVSYAVSRLGNVQRDYTRLAPGATIGDGLAVQGEAVQDAGQEVEAWLRAAGLLAD